MKLKIFQLSETIRWSKTFLLLYLLALCLPSAKAQQPEVKWDSQSLIIGGHRVIPVMGEIHYSRLPVAEWLPALRDMKAGGITMIATYVFWNHIEEQQGVFRWDGQRNLRHFLELCKEENLPVILRVGPFCHGEVRGGGIPDWVLTSGCKTRSEDPQFLSYVRSLYRQIFTQIEGLQWKDGGPVVACQFDNEFGGPASYLLTLKKIALECGFDLPFYTRTGWPGLSTPMPYGEMLPLFGDYADGFWDRSIKEGVGKYYQAFNFKGYRSSVAIASEQLNYKNGTRSTANNEYPYFTCELGGGMMTSYHRRVYLYPEDAYSMALVKLGSGSNLLGYYMYHGGTNPEGLTYLNEKQATLATNYNDLPVKTYDFQAPLGEFGQRNPQFFSLRRIHLFMHDWAETLAPMKATFPCPQDIKQGDDSHLRWSYRSKGNQAFVFVNNYERFQNLKAKKGIQWNVCGVKFPSRPVTVPAGAMAIFPVNIDGIRYATAQLIAKRDGKIYLSQIEGIPTEISFGNKVMRNVKARGTARPIYKNYYLLTPDQASRLFLADSIQPLQPMESQVTVEKVKDGKASRTISIGVAKAAEEPTDADFEQATVFKITNLPKDSVVLRIDYRGDCARLYADGKLIEDNFYNGRPMLYGLWRLPKNITELELRILPLQKNEPVYFPREAKIDQLGAFVDKVSVWR
ncbi:MAG: beta-galactosidase [Prevotella sp.]|jgi:hypothetical protein